MFDSGLVVLSFLQGGLAAVAAGVAAHPAGTRCGGLGELAEGLVFHCGIPVMSPFADEPFAVMAALRL